MCNYLFIAADRPLPPVAWNEASPGMHIGEASARNVETIRNWTSQPFVYEVGSHLGCGCPFGFEIDWESPTEADLQEWQRNRRNFQQLVAYLEQGLKICSTIKLYNASNYWEPPLLQREILIEDILGDRFVFQERELLIVRDHGRLGTIIELE